MGNKNKSTSKKKKRGSTWRNREYTPFDKYSRREQRTWLDFNSEINERFVEVDTINPR